jgi:hypothetical protein
MNNYKMMLVTIFLFSGMFYSGHDSKNVVVFNDYYKIEYKNNH